MGRKTTLAVLEFIYVDADQSGNHSDVGDMGVVIHKIDKWIPHMNENDRLVVLVCAEPSKHITMEVKDNEPEK